MKWRDTPIAKLTDDELRDAIISVADMDKNRVDKLDNKRKRHIKLFAAYPPVENPVFTQLVTELNNEFQSRQLKEI